MGNYMVSPAVIGGWIAALLGSIAITVVILPILWFVEKHQGSTKSLLTSPTPGGSAVPVKEQIDLHCERFPYCHSVGSRQFNGSVAKEYRRFREDCERKSGLIHLMPHQGCTNPASPSSKFCCVDLTHNQRLGNVHDEVTPTRSAAGPAFYVSSFCLSLATFAIIIAVGTITLIFIVKKSLTRLRVVVKLWICTIAFSGCTAVTWALNFIFIDKSDYVHEHVQGMLICVLILTLVGALGLLFTIRNVRELMVKRRIAEGQEYPPQF